MEEHTLGPKRAAVRIDNQCDIWDLDDAHHRPHTFRPERLKVFATFITEETAAERDKLNVILVETIAQHDRLQTERDRLREALIEARVKLGFPIGKQPNGFFSHEVVATVEIIDAALAEPESEADVNPNREEK